jgi:hypothetical protein
MLFYNLHEIPTRLNVSEWRVTITRTIILGIVHLLEFLETMFPPLNVMTETRSFSETLWFEKTQEFG